MVACGGSFESRTACRGFHGSRFARLHILDSAPVCVSVHASTYASVSILLCVKGALRAGGGKSRSRFTV